MRSCSTDARCPSDRRARWLRLGVALALVVVPLLPAPVTDGTAALLTDTVRTTSRVETSTVFPTPTPSAPSDAG